MEFCPPEELYLWKYIFEQEYKQQNKIEKMNALKAGKQKQLPQTSNTKANSWV